MIIDLYVLSLIFMVIFHRYARFAGKLVGSKSSLSLPKIGENDHPQIVVLLLSLPDEIPLAHRNYIPIFSDIFTIPTKWRKARLSHVANVRVFFSWFALYKVGPPR